MLLIGAYSIDLMRGFNHAQGRDVHDVVLIMRVLASAANRRAEICEHASPNPALQVQ